MSDDLIKRLRELAEMATPPYANAAIEAADALEAAQQRIEKLVLISNVNGDWNLKYADAVNRAEAAEAALSAERAAREAAQRELERCKRAYAARGSHEA